MLSHFPAFAASIRVIIHGACLMLLFTLCAPASHAVGRGNDLLPDIPDGNLSVKLEPFANAGLPVTDITNAGDGSGRLFIVSPNGTVRIWKNGSVLATPFMSIPVFNSSNSMTCIEFHPDYANNGKFYIATTIASTPGAHYASPQNNTSSNMDCVIREYQVNSTNPDLADLTTERTLLRVHYAYNDHKMNDLAFGDDGYLYIAAGDGGQGGTPTYYSNNAQNTTLPHGKILRIDVNSTGTNGRYAIPPDNPFFGNTDGNAPEVFEWGIRNPWRISHDRGGSGIWVAVNGHHTIEWIFKATGGNNYGWDEREGTFKFNLNDQDNTIDDGFVDPRFTPPLAQYDHNTGRVGLGSVIGGFVYRGAQMPEFVGQYFCLDYVGGEIYRMDIGNGDLKWVQTEPEGEQLVINRAICWGEDEDGELYIGNVTGAIYKLVSTRPVEPETPVRLGNWELY